MSSKKCPKCGLINTETALRCDCGYDFSSGQVKGSLLGSKEQKSKRKPNQERAAIKYAVLGVVSGFIIPVVIIAFSAIVGVGAIANVVANLAIPLMIGLGVAGYMYGRSKR
jgi:uncharacterized membrane protein YvbJ